MLFARGGPRATGIPVVLQAIGRPGYRVKVSVALALRSFFGERAPRQLLRQRGVMVKGFLFETWERCGRARIARYGLGGGVR